MRRKETDLFDEIIDKYFRLRRTLIIFSPVIFVIFIIVAIYAERILVVQVDQSIETGLGIIQRAEAFDKLIHYTASMDSKRPSGIADENFVYKWIATPTENETKYALEYIKFTVDIYDALKADNKICSDIEHDYENQHDSDEIVIAGSISNYLKYLKSDSYLSSSELVSRLYINLNGC